MGLFKKRQESEQEPNNLRYISDVLVNDVDGELRCKVKDYTENPIDLLIDIHDGLLEGLTFEEAPIVKVCGIISSLNSRIITENVNAYSGFLSLKVFPLYFNVLRSKKEVPDLTREMMMLEAGKTDRITMTGSLFIPSDGTGNPYELRPYVLQLGDYISPAPRE